MEVIPPHRFVVGIRESKNIRGLLSTSSYSKQPSSLTSFCYLPRVREKTGSAELRTRRQTQFPIIWVGGRKGEVRDTELPALSAQLRPQDASSTPVWQVPGYLRHGRVMPSGPQSPEEWRAVEAHDRGDHQVTATGLGKNWPAPKDQRLVSKEMALSSPSPPFESSVLSNLGWPSLARFPLTPTVVLPRASEEMGLKKRGNGGFPEGYKIRTTWMTAPTEPSLEKETWPREAP